jgi:hypothetical protein
VKRKLVFLLLFIVAVLLLAIGGGLVVLLAYGLGWLLTLILPLSIFETTLLSLIGISAVGLGALYFLVTVTTREILKATREAEEIEEDEEEWDTEEEWEDEEEEEPLPPPKVEQPPKYVASLPDEYPGIPKWRQPLKKVDFSKAKPDDRCPCGSGRKYKNCHGFRAKTQ